MKVEPWTSYGGCCVVLVNTITGITVKWNIDVLVMTFLTKCQ